MKPRAATTSTTIPQPIVAAERGTNIGFIAIGLALVLCTGVGASVVGISERAPARDLLEAPGVAWVDGVGVEDGSEVTRVHLIVPDARSRFEVEERPCVFVHGERVRVLSEHDGALHAANDRCSGWLAAGWLSGVARPASGLLK